MDGILGTVLFVTTPMPWINGMTGLLGIVILGMDLDILKKRVVGFTCCTPINGLRYLGFLCDGMSVSSSITCTVYMEVYMELGFDNDWELGMIFLLDNKATPTLTRENANACEWTRRYNCFFLGPLSIGKCRTLACDEAPTRLWTGNPNPGLFGVLGSHRACNLHSPLHPISPDLQTLTVIYSFHKRFPMI